MDSFATWKAREGALRAINCFSDAPELEELSEKTEIAGGGGARRGMETGGGTGGTNRVADEFVKCVGRCGVLCECI